MFNRLRLAQAARGRDVADVTRTFEGSIGVVTGSAWVTFAHEHFPHAKVVEFETWPEVIAAAVSGSVDAGYRDEFEVRRIAIDQPDSAINLRTVAIADARDFISVAVPWTAPQVLAIVDQVIDALPQPYTADLLIDLYRAQSGAAGH
jgi:ABC-type amino acid transport substrate-binding protein